MKSPSAVLRYTLFGLSGDNAVHIYMCVGIYNKKSQ